LQYIDNQVITIRKSYIYLRTSIFVHLSSYIYLPPIFRQTYPEIDWRGLAGLRDKLIHHYFGIDHDILWDVITNEIPSALALLQNVIENEINNPSV
jgi:Protein of unknown function DUF86